MPVHIKHFDRDKALEAILYIAKNLHSPTYHSISKMLYLSDKLAESEIECINNTIAEYGNKTFGELTDITHDKAWNATDDNQTIPLEAIVATLPNAAEVAGYLHAR